MQALQEVSVFNFESHPHNEKENYDYLFTTNEDIKSTIIEFVRANLKTSVGKLVGELSSFRCALENKTHYPELACLRAFEVLWRNHSQHQDVLFYFVENNFFKTPHLFLGYSFYAEYHESTPSSKEYLSLMLKKYYQMTLVRNNVKEFVNQIEVGKKTLTKYLEGKDYISDWVLLNPKSLFVMMSFYSNYEESKKKEELDDDYLILCATLATKKSFSVNLLFESGYRKSLLIFK